jgi:hypothetical protein
LRTFPLSGNEGLVLRPECVDVLLQADDVRLVGDVLGGNFLGALAHGAAVILIA